MVQDLAPSENQGCPTTDFKALFAGVAMTEYVVEGVR